MKASDYLLFSKELLTAYNLLCEPIRNTYHIGQVSFDILMFLFHNPAFSTAQEISEIRNIKKNLVSVHVEKLVQEGYLTRNCVPGDRRKIALAYTEKALPILEEGQKMQRTYFERISAGVSAEELETFRAIHEKIRKNTEGILAAAAKGAIE